MNTPDKITEVCKDVLELLIAKNRKYGDSALNPIRVFSKADPLEQLKVRIDDKLSRISSGHGNDLDEDTVMDLIGYLVLFRVAQKYQEGETPSRSVQDKLSEAVFEFAENFNPTAVKDDEHPTPLKEES